MAENLESKDSPVRNINIVTDKLYSCASALDDLKNVYSNNFLADVKLKTKTNQYPAHKVVLCARSPAFHRMISDSSRRKNVDTIQVYDLEDDVVQLLLIFLYTDNVENLDWETATKLYKAANKYEIEKLKLLCSAFLIKNLTVSTLTELLLLADSHNDSDLKHILEEFALEYGNKACCSKQWEKSDTGRLTRIPLYHDSHHGEKKDNHLYATNDSVEKRSFREGVTKKWKKLLTTNLERDKLRKRRSQQDKMNTFQDRNNQTDPGYKNWDISNVVINQNLLADCNDLFNQRQDTFENTQGITFNNSRQPILDLPDDLQILYQHKSLSSSSIVNNETSLEHFNEGAHQQGQINAFQNATKLKLFQESLCVGNSDAHTQKNNLVSANYSLSQSQGSSRSGSNIHLKNHDLQIFLDSNKSNCKNFQKPEINSNAKIDNQEISKELDGEREHKIKMNKLRSFNIQNISTGNSYHKTYDGHSETGNIVSSTCFPRQESITNAPYNTFTERSSHDLHLTGDSKKAKRRSNPPEHLSENMLTYKETSVAFPTKRGNFQKKMNTFEDAYKQNVLPENCDGFSETENFVSSAFSHSERHESSKNAAGSAAKEHLSRYVHRNMESTQTVRRRFNQTENHSKSMIFNKETSTELPVERLNQQLQMNIPQGVSKQNKIPANSYCENSHPEMEINNFPYTSYSQNRNQEPHEHSSRVKNEQIVSPELKRCGDSSVDRKRHHIFETQSQRMSSSGLKKLIRYIILCFLFLAFICFSCFVIKFVMDKGSLSTLYKNEDLNTATLIQRLRSNFKNQPPLTFRIVGSALKSVLEAEPKAPAIILLLATKGSKTVCSDFALSLVNLLSTPKYTVKIYGETFKHEEPKQTKMEIDQIISKSLKPNQMGSVLIDGVDQIPGQAAIILHKYYDHEYAPFKKAVFVMTADYNMPIGDHNDLNVWQKAAYDHLKREWADAGIDQVTALLSRLIVSVAVITSDT